MNKSGRGLPLIEEPLSKKKQVMQKAAREWGEAWKEERAKYDPMLSILGEERMRRTYELLATLDLKQKKIIDLGCGSGRLLSLIQGEEMTGVDVAAEALELCPSYINKRQGYVPFDPLPEESFDLVILTDVLAEVEPDLYRSLLSESAALLTRGGFFLCSTPLDFHSLDPLGHFLDLLKTEFEVIKIKESYHRLQRHLSKWKSLDRRALLFLERLSKLLWGEGGMTHVIVLCKRKGIYIQ